MVRTVLPVHQVVRILRLRVRLGHLQMEHHLVHPVALESTIIKQARPLVKLVPQEHTKTKPENNRAKHAVLVNFR